MNTPDWLFYLDHKIVIKHDATNTGLQIANAWTLYESTRKYNQQSQTQVIALVPIAI